MTTMERLAAALADRYPIEREWWRTSGSHGR